MDSTRTSGAKNEIKGTAKEIAGKVTGDTSQEIAGKAQKNIGKAQGAVADVVDDVRDETRRTR